MKWIEKYILKRAHKIRERQKVQKQNEDFARAEISEKRNELRKRLTAIVKYYADLIVDAPCHISTGDEVVLNIYNLQKNARNGWDSGPGSLLNFITQKETVTNMPVFRITKIYVDTSLADERIDSYLNNLDDYEIGVLFNQTQDGLEKAYSSWCSRKDASPIWNKWGLYKTAMFSSDCVFQPSWGLNVNSFLLKNSAAGKETIKLYRRSLKEYAKKQDLLVYSEETAKMLKEAVQKYPH